LHFDAGRRQVYVANSRSGTISVLDTTSMQVVREVQVAQRLVDLRPIPGREEFAVLDDAAHELLVIRPGDDGFQVIGRTAVSPAPVRLAVHPDGSPGAVAALWSRTVSLVRFAADGAPHVEHVIRLAFRPRELLFLPQQHRLLAADAFAGRLALIDVDARHVVHEQQLAGHNVHGLALSPDGASVYITYQKLNPLARAGFDDIHWGNLLVNGLRIVPVAALLDPAADLTKASGVEKLGIVGSAAGDPGPIVLDSTGHLIISIAGAGQVACGSPDWGFERLDVGQHPIGLAVDTADERLYVANRLDDTISVIDLAQRSVQQTVPLGPSPDLTPAERGEQLFYNARIAHDGWMSCHSCHSDGHTVDLLVDTLGDGDYGAPKRIPSLLGAVDSAPYAWNGRLATLEEQVRKSVQTTMHGPPLTDEQAADLTSFLQTLVPPANSVRASSNDEGAIARGRVFFESNRCARCHTPPAYTSAESYDVGLVDELGRARFNPPSLRGVGERTAFFHDGRARQLEDVFRVYQHQLAAPATEAELADLVAFLESL
jgi:YVTN family beta-propeller protein